ncbi:MAG: ElyC/SanA/YdcF family protein [Microcoleaceae cyanobacterium]
MTTHIIVPEGLAATDKSPEETFYLSDYFEAVLQAVLKVASPTDLIIITSGNNFGYPHSEEEYASLYLQQRNPELNIIIVSKAKDSSYLDTFDNARLLRSYLQQQDIIITDTIILYCNAPHFFRSWAMFRLCGFNIQQLVGCRPQQIQRPIVPRLWFYDYLPIQYLYECAAFVYDLCRWMIWKAKGSL